MNIMIKCVPRLGFSSLRPLGNVQRNGFRFENQSITWTFEEFDNHSNAFAYGLLDQGWKVGDKLLMLLGRSNTSEAAAVFVGAAKAGVITVPFRSDQEAEIEQAISALNPKGIVFSPNQLIGDRKFISVLQDIVPEASKTQSGQLLKSRFSNLQWLIHTGFYSYPGTYKFRESLCYASKNYNRLSLPQASGPVTAVLRNGQLQSYSLADLAKLSEKVQGSKNVIIAGDPQTVTNFSIVLGGLSKGYYTVFTGGENLQKVAKILPFYKDFSLVVEDAFVENQQEIVKDRSIQGLKEEVQRNLQNLLTPGNVSTVERVFQRQAVQI